MSETDSMEVQLSERQKAAQDEAERRERDWRIDYAPANQLTAEERMERDRRNEARNAAWERQQREQHLELVRSVLPPRYRDAEIDTPLPAGSCYLVGKTGVGKTHAAAATALAVGAEAGNVLWPNITAFLAAVKEGYNEGDRMPPPEELVDGVQLVVLDDLGAERLTDWSRGELYHLVNVIYESQVRLIVTSNVTPDELVRTLGQRCVSRLVEECQIVTLDGPDHRKAKAAERMKAAGNA